MGIRPHRIGEPPPPAVPLSLYPPPPPPPAPPYSGFLGPGGLDGTAPRPERLPESRIRVRQNSVLVRRQGWDVAPAVAERRPGLRRPPAPGRLCCAGPGAPAALAAATHAAAAAAAARGCASASPRNAPPQRGPCPPPNPAASAAAAARGLGCAGLKGRHFGAPASESVGTPPTPLRRCQPPPHPGPTADLGPFTIESPRGPQAPPPAPPDRGGGERKIVVLVVAFVGWSEPMSMSDGVFAIRCVRRSQIMFWPLDIYVRVR